MKLISNTDQVKLKASAQIMYSMCQFSRNFKSLFDLYAGSRNHFNNKVVFYNEEKISLEIATKTGQKLRKITS